MASVRSPLVGNPQGLTPGRSRRLLLGSVAVLATVAILAVVGVQYRNGLLILRAPSPILGEDIVNNGPGPSPIELADFDPNKLYKFDADTDLEHPNRIDNYGCLFSNCDDDDTGPGGLLGKGEEQAWMLFLCSADFC
jgi:hypothetical protein